MSKLRLGADLDNLLKVLLEILAEPGDPHGKQSSERIVVMAKLARRLGRRRKS